MLSVFRLRKIEINLGVIGKKLTAHEEQTGIDEDDRIPPKWALGRGTDLGANFGLSTQLYSLAYQTHMCIKWGCLPWHTRLKFLLCYKGT
jgi:hypothetical protein